MPHTLYPFQFILANRSLFRKKCGGEREEDLRELQIPVCICEYGLEHPNKIVKVLITTFPGTSLRARDGAEFWMFHLRLRVTLEGK